MENILSEYDKSPGIISPDFEKMDLHLPKKAVFAFLGEKRIERFAFARGGEKVGTFVSLTKDFPLWMIKADKEELCVLHFRRRRELRRQSCFWNGSMRMVWKKW